MEVESDHWKLSIGFWEINGAERAEGRMMARRPAI